MTAARPPRSPAARCRRWTRWSIPTTGSVKLRALFDNKDNKLFPNQFVNVRLLVDTLHNQTVVPVAAIQRGADGTFVFVVTPDKTVTQRTVTTGVQDGNNIQILSGLKPGDTVVVDGADRLRDGADVEIPNPTGKITAPSGARRRRCRARRAPCPDGRRGQPRPAARISRRYCPTAQAGPRDAHVPVPEPRLRSARTAPRPSRRCAGAGGGGGRRGGGGGGGGP